MAIWSNSFFWCRARDGHVFIALVDFDQALDPMVLP